MEQPTFSGAEADDRLVGREYAGDDGVDRQGGFHGQSVGVADPRIGEQRGDVPSGVGVAIERRSPVE